jgi:hypothetical protein
MLNILGLLIIHLVINLLVFTLLKKMQESVVFKVEPGRSLSFK